jgi:transposase
VPWGESRSGFTALFERLAISLLQEMSISAVARTLRLSWDQIDGIMQRAIDRGLGLRKDRVVKHIGIDEKSFKKRHKYVTIVTDLDASEVLWVGSGRKRETLDAFWESFSEQQLAGLPAWRWTCGRPTSNPHSTTCLKPKRRSSSTSSMS